MPSTSLLARLWPDRLRHQMMLVLAIVMAAAMSLLYALSTQRLNEIAIDSSQDWAQAVAQTAAAAGAEPLAGERRPELEETLRDISALPGVLRIDVLDADGAALLSLRSLPDGRVESRWRRTDIALPEHGTRGTRLVTVDDTEALQAWAPIGPHGTLGSVGVTFSLTRERANGERLRSDAMLAIALAGLAGIVTVYLLLSRTLVPLQRVVRFSRGLAAHTGERLQGTSGSREVADLTDAMNDASLTLHTQLAQIRASEDRMHAIVHAIPDAMIGFGPDGLIGVASPAVASVFGREPDDLLGTAVHELLPGLDAAEAESRTLQGLFMRSSRSHVARYDATARRHGGTEFPVEISLSRVESEHGVRYACVVRDVTERRMADEMLHLYSRALECTTNGIVISDMSLPGQPVFYANPAFGTITGYDPGDAIGRNCAFLQREDTAQPEIEELRAAVRELRATSVVLRNYRQDGTLFFNELSIAPVAATDGSVRHYVGVLNDVTERERTRMAIAERSARLNAVFDLSPDGFVVFDREGHLVFCNQAFMAMTGVDAADQLAGVTMVEFDRHMRALCEPGQRYPQVAEGPDDAGADLITLARPQHRVLARVVRRQADGQGETILFFRDITRETEVDRMKSEFLTTAAHELRTPMVSVYGFTELLLNRPVPEGRRRDVLETIHRQASLLINMVNELLDLARIEARQGKDMKPEHCRIGDLVQQAVDGLMVHGDTRKVRIAAEHGDAGVHVDPEKMLRALTNVLSNAFKYSPGGGDIELATVDGTIDGAIDGVPAVGLRVTDHGIGMTTAQLQRVFERFFRADPSGNIPGTGLGMSLVKEIVELHRGRVELRSEPGHGTEVTLWLPRVPQAAFREALPAPV